MKHAPAVDPFQWPRQRWHAGLLCLSLVFATACAAADVAAPSRPASVHTEAGRPATSRQHQLASQGYTEQEWRLQGQSQTHAQIGDWAKDGRWTAQATGAARPFATRLLVRRPQDPARFNGTVLVEWLNTALGFDLDGGWVLNRDEILREGYAWVGVSAEPDSITSLKQMQPKRYATASIEDVGLSYDIFTQTASVIRQAAASWGAPQAPAPKLLALGYSQSGSYLITYINALQPTTRAFDGFYLMSTAAVGMPIDKDGSRVFNTAYRPDLNAPVIQVSTEMEVLVGWSLSTTPDTDKLRHWEMAGAAHLDRHMQEEVIALDQPERQLALPHCFKPANTLPSRLFNHAALHGLREWVWRGTPPPVAPRIGRGRIGFVQDDDLGNAQGGLRMPELDAPLAQYGMYSNFPTRQISVWTAYACMAGGSANPLDGDVLRARFANEQAYIQAYTQAADKLLQGGFLRPADHAQLLARAKSVKLPR